MKQHLLTALIVLSTLTGCTSTPPTEPQLVEVPGNGFIKQWEAGLALSGDKVKALFLREDALIVYTESNMGYWLTATGGSFLGRNQLAGTNHTLHPPAYLNGNTIIPTTGSIEVFDRNGRRVISYPMANAVQSPAAPGSGDSLYLAVSHAGNGRLARFDLQKVLVPVWEVYTRNGIVAAPAVHGDAVYAGGVDGKVWAVTASRAALWNTGDDDHTFTTSGSITADLSVDDYGLYIASQDQKLYCLDRISGRIKWTYFATAPLIDKPIVLGDMVYQFVPGVGLVAINKTQGKFAREVMWTQPLARKLLSGDDRYLYVATGDNTIVALDKASGEPKFHSARSDMISFATNVKTPTIYAATSGGTILSVRPVHKPTIGEVVFEEQLVHEPLVMGR